MKPKIRPLLERCVMDGIKYGYNRAHKHVDNPDRQAIEGAILRAIFDEIDEWFDFQEPPA